MQLVSWAAKQACTRLERENFLAIFVEWRRVYCMIQPVIVTLFIKVFHLN
jgi:hypothetical protein